MDLKKFDIGCISVSTAHIPLHTKQALETEVDEKAQRILRVPAVEWRGHGWIFWCHTLYTRRMRQQGHAKLANLIEWSMHSGACFLQLDADAPVVDGLPLFEW
jgi:hypothetical protein